MFLLTNTSHTQYKVSNLKFLIIFTQLCEKFNMYFLWFRQSISFYCLGTLPLVSVLLFVVYRALTKHPASSATIERSGMLWEVPYIAAWKVYKQKHWLHWNTESLHYKWHNGNRPYPSCEKLGQTVTQAANYSFNKPLGA